MHSPCFETLHCDDVCTKASLEAPEAEAEAAALENNKNALISYLLFALFRIVEYAHDLGSSFWSSAWMHVMRYGSIQTCMQPWMLFDFIEE